MDYSLNSQDMQQCLPFPVPIYKYVDINQADDLDQLLTGPAQACIILFESDRNEQNVSYGHWTCLFKTRKGYEFFDSYGKIPDDQKIKIEQINPNFMKMIGMKNNYLSQLLYRAHQHKRLIEYNEAKLQQTDPTIATCGRHVICRLLSRRKPIHQYQYVMKKGKVSPDEKVLILTQPVLDKVIMPTDMAQMLNDFLVDEYK